MIDRRYCRSFWWRGRCRPKPFSRVLCRHVCSRERRKGEKVSRHSGRTSWHGLIQSFVLHLRPLDPPGSLHALARRGAAPPPLFRAIVLLRLASKRTSGIVDGRTLSCSTPSSQSSVFPLLESPARLARSAFRIRDRNNRDEIFRRAGRVYGGFLSRLVVSVARQSDVEGVVAVARAIPLFARSSALPHQLSPRTDPQTRWKPWHRPL